MLTHKDTLKGFSKYLLKFPYMIFKNKIKRAKTVFKIFNGIKEI